MGELRGDDAPGADGLAIEIAHLVDHREAVAAAQIVIEVDVAAEHVGELQRDRIGKVARSAAANSDEVISPTPSPSASRPVPRSTWR